MVVDSARLLHMVKLMSCIYILFSIVEPSKTQRTEKLYSLRLWFWGVKNPSLAAEARS